MPKTITEEDPPEIFETEGNAEPIEILNPPPFIFLWPREIQLACQVKFAIISRGSP